MVAVAELVPVVPAVPFSVQTMISIFYQVKGNSWFSAFLSSEQAKRLGLKRILILSNLSPNRVVETPSTREYHSTLPATCRKALGKDSVSYLSTNAWLRCWISFALLRGSILCSRGSRSHKKCPTQQKYHLTTYACRFYGNVSKKWRWKMILRTVRERRKTEEEHQVS